MAALERDDPAVERARGGPGVRRGRDGGGRAGKGGDWEGKGGGGGWGGVGGGVGSDEAATTSARGTRLGRASGLTMRLASSSASCCARASSPRPSRPCSRAKSASDASGMI